MGVAPLHYIQAVKKMTAGKNRIYLLLKVMVSGGLICLLFLKTDFKAVGERISSIDMYWFAIMIVLPHLAILLSTVKWQLLLKALGKTEALARLFYLYLAGSFFNNFLPGMVGGDVFRISQLSRGTAQISSVVAATFAERFTGITALITFFLLVLFHRSIYEVFPLIKLLIFVVLAGYVLLILLVVRQKYITYLNFLGRFKPIAYILQVVTDSQSKIFQFRKRKKTVLVAYALSLIFYLMAMGTVYAATRTLQIQVDVDVIMVVVPLVLLIGLLPISVNGLGLNEGSYVFFFTLLGLSVADAFSIALLLRARIVLTGILGGLAFMIYPNSARSQAALEGSHTKPHNT